MKKYFIILPFLLVFLGAGCSSVTPKEKLAEQISAIEYKLNNLSLNPDYTSDNFNKVVDDCKKAHNIYDSNDNMNCYSSMRERYSASFRPHKLSSAEQADYKNTMTDPRYFVMDLYCNDIMVACKELLDFSEWEQDFVLYPELQRLSNSLNDLRDSAVHIGSYGILRTNAPFSSKNLINVQELDPEVINSVSIKVKDIFEGLLSIKQKYGIK